MKRIPCFRVPFKLYTRHFKVVQCSFIGLDVNLSGLFTAYYVMSVHVHIDGYNKLHVPMVDSYFFRSIPSSSSEPLFSFEMILTGVLTGCCLTFQKFMYPGDQSKCSGFVV